jgi:lysine biosynthesis protein LysW
MNMTHCINCSSQLYIQLETRRHSIVLCDACGMDLEVASVEPDLVLQIPQDDLYWGE